MLENGSYPDYCDYDSEDFQEENATAIFTGWIFYDEFEYIIPSGVPFFSQGQFNYQFANYLDVIFF